MKQLTLRIIVRQKNVNKNLFNSNSPIMVQAVGWIVVPRATYEMSPGIVITGYTQDTVPAAE